jgi:hypothetical protein
MPSVVLLIISDLLSRGGKARFLEYAGPAEKDEASSVLKNWSFFK